jgi:hypothetical protein
MGVLASVDMYLLKVFYSASSLPLVEMITGSVYFTAPPHFPLQPCLAKGVKGNLSTVLESYLTSYTTIKRTLARDTSKQRREPEVTTSITLLWAISPG